MPIIRQANRKYFLPSSLGLTEEKATADTRDPGVALSSLKARDLKASAQEIRRLRGKELFQEERQQSQGPVS